MNKGDAVNVNQNDIKDQLILDKIHLPKSVVPNSGYGTVTLTYKDFEIVDIKTSITHNIGKGAKKKFS